MLKKSLGALIVLMILGLPALAAPIIANEELTTLLDNLAVITWTTTNAASSSIIEYGINDFSLSKTDATQVLNHYVALQNLYPNTIYQYRVKSVAADNSTTYGPTRTLTTLNPPSGQLLFVFASLADPQYGMGKADTSGARGRPYSQSKQILSETINTIKALSPAFTILKGDLIESSGGANGEFVNNTVIPGDTKNIRQYFDMLTKAADSTYRYYPIPGNHDKTDAAYSGGVAGRRWYDRNLNTLYPGLTVADPTANSCFNYSFDYPTANPLYRFIMLDSLRSDLKSYVDTTYLQAQLASAEALGRKCFIFVHHPMTDIRTEGIPDAVLKEVTGTDPVDYDKIQPTNLTAVQTLITTYRNTIAGVFSGHIHDNKYSEVSGVPVVRTASGLQFPTGFNYYKVYTNGYLQSFWKTPSYTEVARNVITPEAGYSDLYWEQSYLGAASARNFSHTLSSAAPYVSRIAPANTATGIATNSTVIIGFTKAMNQTDTRNAVTVNPVLSGAAYSWDTSGTVLTISHSGLSASTLYTVTVGAGAKDTGGAALLSPYQFTFTSGAAAITIPPTASINQLSNDTSNVPQPVITGVATTTGVSIIRIEFRFNSGTWYDATAFDGAFDNPTENFWVKPQSALVRQPAPHLLEIRCTDAAGNVSTAFATYAFYVIGDRPEVLIESHGTPIYSGDPIEANASFEVTVITNKGLALLTARLNNGAPTTLTAVQANNTYHARFAPTLTDGTYSLKVEATDGEGNITTSEATNLLVEANQSLKLESQPLNFPNPFTSPGPGTTMIAYKLSKSADITLTIHDIMGNQVFKRNFPARAPGGSAGYNEVPWNGTDADGSTVGNGIYVYLIIGEGKVLGRGKLTVLK